MQSAIKIVANENRYHPVRDYLNSLAMGLATAAHLVTPCITFWGADTDESTVYGSLETVPDGSHPAGIQTGGASLRSCSVWLVVREPGNLPFSRLLAGRDEWFSDDLKKLDDENVYRKLQGHWIIEMSEMIATANAKSIEEIKSFCKPPERNLQSAV